MKKYIANEVTPTRGELLEAIEQYASIITTMVEQESNYVTVADIRIKYPELDFLEDDEIEEMLWAAKTQRLKLSEWKKPEL